MTRCYISISKAAGRWRGQRPGATKTASARKTLPAAQPLRLIQARAARAWVTRNRWAAGKVLRADAVFVAPGRWPRHLPAAFEMEM